MDAPTAGGEFARADGELDVTFLDGPFWNKNLISPHLLLPTLLSCLLVQCQQVSATPLETVPPFGCFTAGPPARASGIQQVPTSNRDITPDITPQSQFPAFWC